MCGLAGILTTDASADWSRARRALTQIAHRGPDGEGLVGISADGKFHTTDTPVNHLFGFRRLSIFDLTTAADQPMRCPHTGNLLLFNGAIYNFLELRSELESTGYPFRTQSDSEVILAAYAAWGDAAFAKFNGMWAIALYDAATGDVLLSRDRIGIKPLYYVAQHNRFVFGSEIRVVTTLAGISPSINDTAAFDFLAGILLDHGTDTLLNDIHSIPAGSLWRIRRDGTILRARYHDWQTTPTQTHSPEALHALLTDSVRLRLRSDAPSVSLLSGGLDSSIITWLAASEHQHTKRCQFTGAFSYGYDDPRFAEHDEIARAQTLIAELPHPISHTIVRTSPQPDINELLALIRTQELPTATPSILAGWRLYQQIHQSGIKVALSGEGADELFLGYTRLFLPLLARDHLLRGNLHAFSKLLQSPHLSLKQLALQLGWHIPHPILTKLLRSNRPNITALHAGFWNTHQPRFTDILHWRNLPLEQRMRRDILDTALPPILRYADRNSMGAGVELRLPFLDYRVIDYALTLPISETLDADGGKRALRRAFAHTLPARVLAQPKTHGLGNAEQFQLPELNLLPLLERAPAEAWHYLDRPTLTRALSEKRTHPMLWLPIAFLLWLTARHEA